MSESDVIRVTVDDSDLDAAIAKIQQIAAMSEEVTGKTRGPGQKGLPGINREMRLVLSQIPGVREAIQVYFRLSRMVRGFQLGDFSLYVTLIATAIVVLKRIMEHQQELEQNQRQYEAFIIKERRLRTKEEAQALIERWESNARSRPG